MSPRRLLIVALLWATGCVQSIGPFVRDVQVHGRYLIVQKCMIDKSGDTISVGSCTTERVALPVTEAYPPAPTTRPSPPTPPAAAGLTREQVIETVQQMKPLVAACGPTFAVSGTVRATITVDRNGAARVVKLAHDNVDFQRCVKRAIAAYKFSTADNATTFTFPFEFAERNAAP